MFNEFVRNIKSLEQGLHDRPIGIMEIEMLTLLQRQDRPGA